MDYKTVIEKLLARQDLDADEMHGAMDAIMDGQLTPAQVAAFLVAVRMKGETVTEIAAAARSMRAHATPVDAGPPPVVDIVGTGGDGAGTFNVSTTAAIVAAAAGVTVAKHGNRSVSSACGSADVLKALGVNIELGAPQVAQCLRELRLGFLYAPRLHGAMKHASGPRRELGVRTIFNLLGPLTNPAGASALVVGVYEARLIGVHVRVLQQLGAARALVVHGDDGLDEITATTTTTVAELREGRIAEYKLDPRRYLGAYCQAADLKGGDASANAALVRAIVTGQDRGPRRGIAQLTAGAGLYVGGAARTLDEGYEQAGATIDSGQAARKLAALVDLSTRLGATAGG